MRPSSPRRPVSVAPETRTTPAGSDTCTRHEAASVQRKSANGAGSPSPVPGASGTGKHHASEVKPPDRASGPPLSTTGTAVRQEAVICTDSPGARGRGSLTARTASRCRPSSAAEVPSTVQLTTSIRPPTSPGKNRNRTWSTGSLSWFTHRRFIEPSREARSAAIARSSSGWCCAATARRRPMRRRGLHRRCERRSRSLSRTRRRPGRPQGRRRGPCACASIARRAGRLARCQARARPCAAARPYCAVAAAPLH